MWCKSNPGALRGIEGLPGNCNKYSHKRHRDQSIVMDGISSFIEKDLGGSVELDCELSLGALHDPKFIRLHLLDLWLHTPRRKRLFWSGEFVVERNRR